MFLKIDPLALESVISNLLDNAIKYTDREGKISVRLEPHNGLVRLSVSDTGQGIPAEEQRTVFESYYQFSHRMRNVQGIGMGLNIVKKIMDEAGGTITLSSAGRGTVFVLEFPGVPPEERERIIDDGGASPKALLERYGISKRQTAIIALLKGGLLSKEISARLNISINTLNTQIRRIFKKCRVQNKTELLNIFTDGGRPPA